MAYPSDLKRNVAFLLHILILIESGEDSSSGSLSPPLDGSLNDWEFLPQNHLTMGRSSGINAKKSSPTSLSICHYQDQSVRKWNAPF